MNQPHHKPTMVIFTDASLSPKNMVSIGAFLILDQKQLDQYARDTAEILATTFEEKLVYKKFDSNKSTWSEIKTIIAALHAVVDKSGPDVYIEIYTDCQNFCDLMNKRKEKLERNNFISRSGKILEHAQLYKELFTLTNQLQIKIFKIKGHASSAHRLTVHEKIFTILDKLCRKKLRSILKHV